MSSFLTFSIFAPLASWGDIAVGEVRGSLDRPTRSGILGLIAGAMGIERGAQDELDALDDGYGLAVHAVTTGRAMTDYHTIQSLAATDVRRHSPRTRREAVELGRPDPPTMLSYRQLRQESLAVLALWAQQGARWSLEHIAEALRMPRFVPYAGRKANVLALPMGARVVEGETLAEVLEQASRQPMRFLAGLPMPRGGWGREVYHDELSPAAMRGLERQRTVRRRDRQANRDRWQFRDQVWNVSVLSGEA